MKFSHLKGFTLVELMIVIAILGILFVSMQQFNASPSIYQEKADRLANHIHDIIRDTKYQMILGATEKDNSGNLKVPIKKEIHIEDFRDDIKIKTYFDDNSYLITYSGSLKLDNDNNYNIKHQGRQEGKTEWDERLKQHGMIIKLHKQLPMSIAPTHTGSTLYNGFRIVVDYKGFKRYVEINHLTGNVEITTKP